MKHIISTIYQALGDTIQEAYETVALTGQAAVEIDQPIAASGTPINVNCGFAPGKVQSIIMTADVNCTVGGIDVNDDPNGSITLLAGKPFLVYSGKNPATDLTALFTDSIKSLQITNTSSPLAAGTFKLRMLVDPS